jgi:hypothetical protein
MIDSRQEYLCVNFPDLSGSVLELADINSITRKMNHWEARIRVRGMKAPVL